MTADVGKREAHKIATRRAIQAAADALFDARGYADTTVRDIADAAGVTERTFFRYFAGKEALLVKDLEAWLPVLGAEIRNRPAGERPLEAIEQAFFAVAPLLRGDSDTNVSWLFHDGPPGPTLAKSRPGLLFRIEQEIADALADRARQSHVGREFDEFSCQVIARTAVAALRSAGIRHWQLREANDGGQRPTAAALAHRAFEILRESEDAHHDRRA